MADRGRGRGNFRGGSRGGGGPRGSSDPSRGGAGGRGGFGGQRGTGNRPPPTTYQAGGRLPPGYQPGDGGTNLPAGEQLLVSHGGPDRAPRNTKLVHRRPDTDKNVLDTEAMKVESKYANNKDKLSQMHIGDAFPYRPNYGISGRKIQVLANFFAINTPAKLTLHQYAIWTEPDMSKLKRKRTDIVKAALDLLPGANLRRDRYVCDFAQILLTLDTIKPIEEAKYEVYDKKTKEKAPTYVVVVRDFPEDGTDAVDNPKTFQVKFRPVKHHHIHDILTYLSDPTAGHMASDDKSQTIQMLNIFLGHHARTSDNIFLKTSSSRNKIWHVDTERMDIGAGLQALKGFFSSVRWATGRILLNVNNAAIAGYKPVNLMDTMKAYREAGHSIQQVEGFIKTVRVRRPWLEKTNKEGKVIRKDKTVLGFANKNDGQKAEDTDDRTVIVPEYAATPEQVRFRLPNGTYMSVQAFFKTQHKYVIKEPRLPVINVGTKPKPIYVPAELLQIVDGQDSSSKLDSNQTDAMMRFTVNQPWFNFKYIEQRAPPVLGLDSALLKQAKIVIQPKLIMIEARELPPPRIGYFGQKFVNARFGGWNMINQRVMKGASAPRDWKFVIINTAPNNNGFASNGRANEDGVKFVQLFAQELKNLGLRDITSPSIEVTNLNVSNMANFKSQLEHLFTNAKSSFLFLALPDKLPEIWYKIIKHSADVTHGINTVCMGVNKLRKTMHSNKPENIHQHMANIGLKVNTKLGGNNQAPDASKLKFLTEGKTMVVGLDVTHPAPGAKETSNSVAAMVANIDGALGQWPAALEINGHRKEAVSTVESMLMSRLDLWKTKGGNSNFPENIMLFRDGVSEGQFQTVVTTELPMIRAAINKKYGKQTKPRVFIAICGKRHQVRFAPSSIDDVDNGNNTKAGLVVDSGITESRMWDFYLQAHAAIQGTARSCHYTVVYDEIFSNAKAVQEFGRPGISKADLLQELCNALAYMYPRATKAVSLATPAKLADLACDRARAYVAGIIDSDGGPLPASSQGTSQQGNQNQTQADAQQRALIAVHPNLRNTMFYI